MESNTLVTDSTEKVFEEVVGWTRDDLGMTDGEIARAIGTSQSQLFQYEEYGSGEVEQRIEKVLYLWMVKRLIQQLTGEEEAISWIHSPNKNLGGKAPLYYLRYGSLAPIVGALADLDQSD